MKSLECQHETGYMEPDTGAWICRECDEQDDPLESPYAQAAKAIGSEAMMKSPDEETLDEHPSFTRAKALPEPWKSHFPKSVEEAKAFEPHIIRRALASTVLVVARTRVECAWAAYIMGIPGRNHDDEEAEVLKHGDKLPEDLARYLFPILDEVPYAR